MSPLIDAAGRPLKGAKSDAQPTNAGSGAAPVPAGPSAGTHVKESSLQTFAADVLDASMEVPVIVDFWAPWCGPCRAMAPAFERAAGLLEPHVRFVKLNTDEAPGVASRFQISSIPTLMVFRGGQVIARTAGALPSQQLIEWIRAAVA